MKACNNHCNCRENRKIIGKIGERYVEDINRCPNRRLIGAIDMKQSVFINIKKNS